MCTRKSKCDSILPLENNVLDVMLLDGSSEKDELDDVVAALDDKMVDDEDSISWEDEVSTI